METSHQDICEQFSAYVDRELPTKQARHVESHLKECQPCASEYQAFLQTIQTVAALPKEALPPRFVSQVQSRIRARSKGRFFTRNKVSPFLSLQAALIAVLFILFALYMWSHLPMNYHVSPLAPTAPAPAPANP